MTVRDPEETTICVVQAVDAPAAAALADELMDQLAGRLPAGVLRAVRAVGTAVVVVCAGRAVAYPAVTSVNTVMSDPGLGVHVNWMTSPPWKFFGDRTVGVDRILGDDPDVWAAFVGFLPGTTDSLVNLARVAVSVSVPARAVSVAPTAGHPSAGVGSPVV